MNVEQLSQMPEDDLRARANELLTGFESENVSAQMKAENVTLAQIFQAELDRREQARERAESARSAQRDYKLEIWVIVLIGAELVLAIVGIGFGWVEGSKQTRVLDQLNKNSAATAATLSTVQTEQAASLETQKRTLENIVAMNDELQDELDFKLAGSIQYSGGMFGKGINKIDFTNNGESTLILWGSKLGNEPPVMRKRPQVLIPGGKVEFDWHQWVEKTTKKMGAATQVSVPIEFYLKRANGTKYVSAGTVALNQGGSIYIQRMLTTRKQW
jgi:hypothetical protein